jgi:hypothetical protein
VGKPKDYGEEKGHTSLGVTGARVMKDCGIVVEVGT